MKLSRAVSVFADLLFPPRCIFCEQIVAPGCKICEKCAEEIVPVNNSECINISLFGKNVPCAVLYIYADKVRQSIIRFKFYGEKKYADFYAEALAEQILKIYQSVKIDAVTAVPISDERRKIRGYNQSEIVARKTAEKLNLPYDDFLVKKTDNREQHRLSSPQRRQNVKGVYRLSGIEAAGKSILIIDDIVTTGSTLSECAEVLFSGGAGMVYCAVLARAETV